MPLLEPESADALIALEKDTDGLIYLDLWRDATSSLLAKRLTRTSQLPGYSPHNYGISIDIDVKSILEQKKIRYEDLLYLMKRRGWMCHRRDGDETKLNSGHFNYLGNAPDVYLVKCTQDPTTWSTPAETKIFDRYNSYFQLSTQQVQEKLSKLGLYKGPISGQLDMYTREAVLAFQRTWDLVQNGFVDANLTRVLAFVTAEIAII